MSKPSPSRTPYGELTPWFPADVNPARKGVYMRDLPWAGIYSHWNGAHWCGWAHTPRGAAATGRAGYVSSVQHVPWRGLAEKPRKS